MSIYFVKCLTTCAYTHTQREREVTHTHTEKERERGNTHIREKRVSSASIITLAIIVVKKLR